MSILPRQSATLCVLRAQRRNGELSLQRGANLQLPTLPLSGPRTKHIRPPSGNSSSRAARVSTIASGGAASVSGQDERGFAAVAVHTTSSLQRRVRTAAPVPSPRFSLHTVVVLRHRLGDCAAHCHRGKRDTGPTLR